MKKSAKDLLKEVREIRKVLANFPEDSIGPWSSVLSTLPAYGTSNAALPRGDDGYMKPVEAKSSELGFEPPKGWKLKEYKPNSYILIKGFGSSVEGIFVGRRWAFRGNDVPLKVYSGSLKRGLLKAVEKVK